MAAILNTYTDLATQLSDWLNRDDLTATQIQMFIELGEVYIFQKLRIKEMETTTSTAISASVIPVPSRYLSLKNAYVSSSPNQALIRTTPEFIRTRYPLSGSTGKPLYIAREGTNFIFGPAPDSNYTIAYTYYQRPTQLTPDATTNTIFPTVASLYFYAALVESATFTGEEDRVPLWAQKVSTLLDMHNGTNEEDLMVGASYISTPG